MSTHDIQLMSHLLRRAGFGGTREEIESKSLEPSESGAEAVVVIPPHSTQVLVFSGQ